MESRKQAIRNRINKLEKMQAIINKLLIILLIVFSVLALFNRGNIIILGVFLVGLIVSGGVALWVSQELDSEKLVLFYLRHEK